MFQGRSSDRGEVLGHPLSVLFRTSWSRVVQQQTTAWRGHLTIVFKDCKLAVFSGGIVSPEFMCGNLERDFC